jgi:hypothetical protein
MHEAITWNDNKKLMGSLWPRWKPTPEQGALINERWGSLHQDKLRDCIREDAMQSRSRPNIPAINRAYGRITGAARVQDNARTETTRTREALQSCQPIPPKEIADWERWADEVLSTATPAELEAVKQRIGVGCETRRVLAVAVDYCRANPVR